jgi:hypothetical protein
MNEKVEEFNPQTDMLFGDWTAGVFKNIRSIKTALWVLVILEAAKFILW